MLQRPIKLAFLQTTGRWLAVQKNMLKISHTFQPESNIEWLSLIFSSERFARARERRQCWVSVSFKYSERSCRSWVFKDSTPNEAERGWVDMRQGRAADRRSIQQVSCMERHGAGYSGRRLKKVAERQLKPCQELPNTTSRGFLFHHFLVKTKTPKSAGHAWVRPASRFTRCTRKGFTNSCQP